MEYQMQEKPQEEVAEQHYYDPKPAMSSIAIAGGMMGLGVVMLIRGTAYFLSFVKAEKAWVKAYKL